MIEFSAYDTADYLVDDETIAEYLTAVLEENDPELFVAALGKIAKARGMAEIAKKAGLGRESLYKALKPGSKLRYETVQKITTALGVKITFQPAA
ncbi:MAG: addiction module antidote protein [Mesorhizobium sp.]|jgi:probable addiction module antidote protein